MMRTAIRLSAVLLILAAVAVAPAMAQEVYTNKDLKEIHIPGAYTNKDLKFLAPIPTQKAPLFEPGPEDVVLLEEIFPEPDLRVEVLIDVRDRLQAELDYLNARIELAYSPAGGNFTGNDRPGLISKLQDRLDYLHEQIDLRNWQIDRLRR